MHYGGTDGIWKECCGWISKDVVVHGRPFDGVAPVLNKPEPGPAPSFKGWG